MTAEYIGITTHTKAVCFIALGTHYNCLNWTILLSIQKYTSRTAEYIGMVTTYTKAVCLIALGTHYNCLNGTVPVSIQNYTHMIAEYIGMVTIYTKKVCLLYSPEYSLELPQWDSSTEYSNNYPYDCRIYVNDNYSHFSCLFYSYGDSLELSQQLYWVSKDKLIWLKNIQAW